MSLTTDRLAPSYRSPRLLATLVTAGFVPYLAGSLYQLSLVWRRLGYAHAVAAGEAVSEQEGTAIDAALEALWMPQIAIWIVGLVLFLVWTYRVARNRDAFGEPGESPAWCVTSYFVPIANLWSPLTALQTVWIGSDPTPRTDQDGDPIRFRAESSPLLVAWWVAWIASTILERISAGAADSDYVWWANITLVTVAVDTVALALMLRVVWALTHRQEERAAGGLARASIPRVARTDQVHSAGTSVGLPRMSAESPLPGAPFRSPTYLAKLVTVVFAPQLAGVAFRWWTVWQALGLAEADLTATPRVHQEQLTALEAAYTGTSGVFVLFFFLGLVPFCMWTYRVASNARAFGATAPEPAFAVGWFFVPIAQLFMPAVSFARIWNASVPDERRGTPTLVVAWWLTYLLSLAFGAMAAGRIDFTISPAGSVAFLRMATFIHAIDALAVGLLLAMVWILTRRQERRAARPVPRAAHLIPPQPTEGAAA